MQELTDDQLDGLFRKSAEEFDSPFDPTAWQDMQARLDANGPTAPVSSSAIWKNLLRWELPALLLLLGSVWYVNRDGEPHPGTLPVRSRAVQEQSMRSTRLTVPGNGALSTEVPTADAPTAGAPGNVKEVSDEPSLATSKSVAAVPPAGNVKRTVRPTDVTTGAPKRSTHGRQPDADGKVQNLDVATKTVVSAYGVVETRSGRSTSGTKSLRSERVVEATKVFGNRLRNRSAFPANGPTRRTRKEVEPPISPDFSPTIYAGNGRQSFTKRSVTSRIVESSVDGREVATETGPGNENNEERLLLPMINELPGRSVRWSEPALELSRAVMMPTDPVDNAVQTQSVAPHGLSVRLLVAPDLSAVGLRNFSRPGTNVGLLLEYRLGQRWSVQTGVIQSTKVYRAQTSDYSFPYMWSVMPEGVDGRCSMLDIPINVRYDFALQSRSDGRWQPNRWFVSGGLTSYYMEQETYTFVYDDPANPHIYPKNRGWSGSTGGYGFSQLNLSVGYERSFSRRLSWQAEPFLKAPLKGIGNYKINLLSTGAFFSIRYKL